MIDPAAFIHPMAHVEGATLGARTRVWQFASVIRGAKLGEDCVVGDGAIVDGATIGDRCLIGHGSAINPGIIIGDDVFVGPGVVLCNDAWPTVDKAGFAPELFEGGFVTLRIEDGASLGARAVVLPGIVIGGGAMVAAGSIVTQDVPPHSIWKDGRLEAIDPRRDKKRMREALWIG